MWPRRERSDPTSLKPQSLVRKSTNPSSTSKVGAAPSVVERRRQHDDLQQITTTTQESFEDFSATYATTVSWEGDLNPRNYMRLRQLISRHHQQLSGDVLKLLPLWSLAGWGSEEVGKCSCWDKSHPLSACPFRNDF